MSDDKDNRIEWNEAIYGICMAVVVIVGLICATTIIRGCQG